MKLAGALVIGAVMVTLLLIYAAYVWIVDRVIGWLMGKAGYAEGER